MKKTYLDDKRMKMYADFGATFNDTSLSYEYRGRYMEAVLYFLTHAEEVSKRGYRRFCKDEAQWLIAHGSAKDGILRFLNTKGLGFRKVKADQPKEKRLEKMEKMDERHKQQIDAFIVWLNNERDYSPHTLQTYVNALKQFYLYCDDFNQDNARRFIYTCEQDGLAPQTIRLRITSLEKFGEFTGKPVTIKRPKFRRKLNIDNVPTEKEYNMLLDYLDAHHQEKFAFMVRLMGTTGCRVSELVQFTYEQVQQGTCTLKGKGSKYRQFFFTRQMQQAAKGKSGPVCLNRYGTAMSTRGVSQMLKDYGKKAGIDPKKMHPHAFRHFFAKQYLQKTKDVVGLADILGHGSVDTTRIYLQKSKEEQQRGFNRAVTW